ncbi:MAG: twin-arginine translocase subunit TatC [Armatimonadota bacterium]
MNLFKRFAKISDSTDNSAKELGLFEHLAELRFRIIRCLIYVAIGMIAGWFFSEDVYNLLKAPVLPILENSGSTFISTDILEGFMVKMTMSLLVGILISIPFLTIEGWGFIAPGLTKQERKGVWMVAPLSIILFASGILVAYYILPAGVRWLISQNFSEVKFMPKVQQTILFILKMCLAFGIVFQLPVILMFLARIGIINSNMLKSYWKHAIIILAIISAVITPSSDAFSMLMMCLPLIGLYSLSIGLVRLVEKRT